MISLFSHNLYPPVEKYVVPDVDGGKDGKERSDVATSKVSVKKEREDEIKERAADEGNRGGDEHLARAFFPNAVGAFVFSEEVFVGKRHDGKKVEPVGDVPDEVKVRAQCRA